MGVADWTVLENEEDAEEAKEHLKLLLPRIEEFESLMEPGANPVHPGSALAGDDRAISPRSLSVTCWAPILVAIDHLSLLRGALSEMSSLNPTAPYTLLRPAIEGAAWGIWVLAPTSRDERVTRALRLVLLDETDSRRVSAARGAPPVATAEQLNAHLLEIARKRPSIDPSAVLKRPIATAVVRQASHEVDQGSDEGLLWWTMLSAISHGRPHGLLALLQREQLVQREQLAVSDLGQRSLRLAPSLVAIAHGTELAYRFVDHALRLYAMRNTAPSDRTPLDIGA